MYSLFFFTTNYQGISQVQMTIFVLNHRYFKFYSMVSPCKFLFLFYSVSFDSLQEVCAVGKLMQCGVMTSTGVCYAPHNELRLRLCISSTSSARSYRCASRSPIIGAGDRHVSCRYDWYRVIFILRLSHLLTCLLSWLNIAFHSGPGMSFTTVTSQKWGNLYSNKSWSEGTSNFSQAPSTLTFVLDRFPKTTWSCTPQADAALLTPFFFSASASQSSQTIEFNKRSTLYQ